MTKNLSHFFRYQFPAVLWAMLIFVASSIPGTKLPKLALLVNDKIIHATIFFVFGLLMYRALESPAKKLGIFEWRRLSIAVVIVILYGFADEFHQGFVPGRTLDIKDAAADAVGGIISGAVVYLAALRKKLKGRY